ncbi:MAG: CHAD domain-containing protein [Xanthomonadales bacterium]|nr:CHAD domain-containing protein [Xanthomonadales bacterium]
MSARATGHSLPELHPGMDAGEALQQVIDACLGDYERHLAGLMASDDPRGPHGSRVALRRLRTALRGFRPILDLAMVLPVELEARALFRLIGPLRDADVLAGRAGSGRGSGSLSPARSPGLSGSRESEPDPLPALPALRTQTRQALTARRAQAFADRVRDLFAGPLWRRRGGKARRRRKGPAADLARHALDRAWQRARRADPDLAALDEAARHRLRKDLKALRYLSEFFTPLLPDLPLARETRRLKALQDDLGTLTDLDLARRSGVSGAMTAHFDEPAAEALGRAAQRWHALLHDELSPDDGSG